MIERKLTASTLRRAVYGRNPMSWFECESKIQRKEVGDQLSDQSPSANIMQAMMGEAVEWMEDSNLPVRLIVYKPRQKGCSTGTVCLGYAKSRSRRMRWLVIGGQASQTDNLWKILKHYGATDGADWGNTWTCNETTGKCSNGSLWERETAGDAEAGRSGTYHGAIVTELARWPTDGKKNAGDVMTSVMNCIPKLPGTMIVFESTANGPEGPFVDTWNKAVSLEQMKAGKRGNGFVKIFCPWHVFDDSVLPLPPDCGEKWLRDELLAAGDDKALELWESLGLSLEQVYYYHSLLQTQECNGDPMKRDREYPTKPEDGFRASAPSRFDLKKLAELEKIAEAEKGQLQWGNLELPATQLRLRPEQRDYRKAEWVTCSEAQASLCMVEAPRVGMAYSGAADNAKGLSLVQGDDTDCHAFGIHRAGYFRPSDNEWQHPRIVMSLVAGVRWEQDELAELMAKAAGYYGSCPLVPESNRAELLLSELRLRRCMIWRRPQPTDKADTWKDTGLLGWETTAETKKAAVENLARHIREMNKVGAGLRCPFPWIIKEMQTFVRHKDGTEGAMKLRGIHDDHVAMLFILWMTKDCATVYADQEERRKARRGDW